MFRNFFIFVVLYFRWSTQTIVGASRCAGHFQVVHRSFKGSGSPQGPLNSRYVHFGITYRIRLTGGLSNIIIHAGGNIGITSSFLHVLLCSGTCYDHRFSTDLISLSHELLPCQADVIFILSAGRASLPSKVLLLSGTIIPTSPTHRGHSAHNREHTRRISRRHRKQAW